MIWQDIKELEWLGAITDDIMERHINSSIIWNTWQNESNFSTRKTVKPITIDKDCLNSCLEIDHRPSYWTKCIVHQCKDDPTLLAPEIIDETHPQTENNLSCRPITRFKSSATTQGFLPTTHLRLHKSDHSCLLLLVLHFWNHKWKTQKKTAP